MTAFQMSSGLAFGQLIYLFIIKEKFLTQTELMSFSHGFRENCIFLAFREKMVCSEPSQHWVRMDLAWGENRGSEESRGTRCSRPLVVQVSDCQTQARPLTSVSKSSPAWRAGPGMLHLAGFSHLIQSTPWELSLQRFRKLKVLEWKSKREAAQF